MSHPAPLLSLRSAPPWIPTVLAVLAAAGCVLDPGAGAGGGGGGGAGGGGGVLEGTDAQVCGAACGELIDCGAELDQDGCKSSCLSSANGSLPACFRQVTAACDPLARCVLGELCGPGGVPSGSDACAAGASCLIGCAGVADTTCGCACMGGVRADDAAAIYAVAVCASVHCDFECGAFGDTASCQSCLNGQCASAGAGCK